MGKNGAIYNTEKTFQIPNEIKAIQRILTDLFNIYVSHDLYSHYFNYIFISAAKGNSVDSLVDDFLNSHVERAVVSVHS